MMAFAVGLHILICACLIIIILIQSSRGGGLVENFSSVESMFGPKTNEFLTRATSVLAMLFFITCVGLAFLSAQQSHSLMRNLKRTHPAAQGAQNGTVPVSNSTAQ